MPIQPPPLTALPNPVKPLVVPPPQPSQKPPPSQLFHLFFPQTTTTQKQKQTHNTFWHPHTKEMLTNIGYIHLQQHQNQTAQEIHSPIQGAPKHQLTSISTNS